MTTIGWLLVMFAGVLVHGVLKGRSITQIPGDMGDLFTAYVTGDTAKVSDILTRTGDSNDPTVLTATGIQTSNAIPPDNTLHDGMPTVGNSKAALIQAGHAFESMGYSVSEHPSFGGVTPGAHVKNSQHYIGEAIDINADTGFRGGERMALDNANRMAIAAGFTTLWQVAGHYDHLHVAVKH